MLAKTQFHTHRGIHLHLATASRDNHDAAIAVKKENSKREAHKRQRIITSWAEREFQGTLAHHQVSSWTECA
jgi:hypothetical protein